MLQPIVQAGAEVLIPERVIPPAFPSSGRVGYAFFHTVSWPPSGGNDFLAFSRTIYPDFSRLFALNRQVILVMGKKMTDD